MSLKAELETWAAALKAYDEENYDRSLDLFSSISDSSRILTNMGLIYATLGEHEIAVEKFLEATQLDQYLAVAYFQCGVSNFLLTRYELAYKDFEEAFFYLRGNQTINYEQLGLKFRLYSAEVLFNKGLSQIYLGRTQQGMMDMQEAQKDKATDEHNVIDDAIAEKGEGYTVFSIPVGVLYRPSEKKLKNAAAKDYMGKAKLIAASDPGDAYTTFTGVTRLKQGISPAGVYVDRPDTNLSRSATAPAPSVPKLDGAEASNRTGLSRSKTTLNVPANAREMTTGLGRSLTNTSKNPSPAPVRGLSVRRPGQTPSDPPTLPPPSIPAKDNDPRMTEFYDDYLNAYEDDAPPLPPVVAATAPPDRVTAWAKSNANVGYVSATTPPTRSASRVGGPNSNYTPSSYGSVRRKLTRRNGSVSGSGRQSRFEEDEEGYGSGDYDEGPFELVKIRVKLHYADDVRGMALDPHTTFEEFMEKVSAKFGVPLGALSLRFKDEDGGRVSMRDESDYEMAIETARESSKGKPEGKLELWCTDNK